MIRLKQIQNLLSMTKEDIRLGLKPQFKQVYEKYLHSYETRSSDQITATTQKIQKVSQKNIARLSKINDNSLVYDKEKYKNCIFICLSGIPAFPKQFDNLILPGIPFVVISNGFQFQKDDLYRQQNLPRCKFSENAQKIHKIIQQYPNKDIVFIYHSFGTYNLSVYFEKYGAQRVKGLIQIGAAPIRHYYYVNQVTNYILKLTEHQMITNYKEIAGKGFEALVDRVNKEIGVKWDYFPSATYGASFLHYFKSPQFPILFDLNRRYPNVLKLMIFGEDDKLFERDLLCERAHFYCKQEIQNQEKLKANFIVRYGQKTEKIQQNFIFMIPEGKHSIHMQKKMQPLLNKAIYEYFQLIFG